MRGQRKARTQEERRESLPTIDATVDVWTLLGKPCEDDFLQGAELQARADTEAKAKEALAKKVQDFAQAYEDQDALGCKTKSCEEGSCVFDYALVGEPKCEKEPDLVTVKYNKRVRGKWVCRQELRLGCFCVREF
jgi:hypothetical protein